ncbi:MAG TPA: folylpolyglutamate synthase/dihydrofolate synthase family protein, partial [Pirellulaceae bacterium]|nr:folylpolyglutamate synthase/dihydrofolate synthase family protein [Pirellulaceae bacterium]
IKAVHLAGTKGKGSTAAMIAAVLTAAGYRTGLYISPHLERIEERIAIDGAICPPERLVVLAARLQAAEACLREGLSPDDVANYPTFFEITTALAFLHFAEAKVDVAVLEVGLGGRLDSTNVCSPEVAVITSISFDHMRQLGNTLAAIAGEKAGIIKPGVPVISGVMTEEPRQVIANRATDLGAQLYQRGGDFDFTRHAGVHIAGAPGSGEVLDYREPGGTAAVELPGLALGMTGEHQAANAACAVAALLRMRERGWTIPEAAIRAGLAAARCPARIEVVPGPPTAVIDVAHNPASIAALVEVLAEQMAGRRKVLIFASSRDKDYAAMLRLLVPRFEAVVLTQYVHNPRAMEAEELASLTRTIAGEQSTALSHPQIHVAQDPPQAWRLAQQLAGPGDAICITGSFFLAAELRGLVLQTSVERCDRPTPSAA